VFPVWKHHGKATLRKDKTQKHDEWHKESAVGQPVLVEEKIAKVLLLP